MILEAFRQLGPRRFFWICLQRLKGVKDPIHLWDDDVQFSSLYERIAPYTLVKKPASYVLYQCVRQAKSVAGSAAEVGVYRGGTALLIASATEKVLHLFDTFEGMPKTGAQDMHRAGDFADSDIDAVRRLLSGRAGVAFYPGRFPDTAHTLRSERFALVHIDVDIYSSVLDCCEFFYPQMSPGGVMVFDDYGFLTCPGARQAVNSFFKDKPEQPVYLPTGQAIVTKLP